MKLLKKAVAEYSSVPSIDSLISTKFEIPPLRAKLLPRKQLLQRLGKAPESRMILMSGMAASGKTSLVAQWLKEYGAIAAWYSLDQDDNDPDLFLRYLLSAIGSLDSNLNTFVQKWVHSRTNLNFDNIMPVLIRRLSRLQEDRYLILDDYHHVVDSAVHDIISNFINHLPKRFHLIILTRYSLPFAVSKLRMRGHLMEISAEDMKLTQSEARHFFRDIMPCSLTDRQIEDIHKKTEGWIGGLQLFGLSRRKNANLSKPALDEQAINRQTADYLIDEVLNAQDAEIRSFLLTTCFLDRFNVDICQELFPNGNAGEILDYLDRNNLFLVRLDQNGMWYRYHHLFSDALRSRSLTAFPKRVTEIHRQAADWFSKNGYVEDALRHAFAIGDLEFTATILEKHMDTFFKCDPLSAKRWLDRLPQEIHAQRPFLRLFECKLCLDAHQIESAQAILEDLEKRRDFLLADYTDIQRSAFHNAFITQRALLMYTRNPLQPDLDHIEEYVKLSRENPAFAVVIKTLLSASYFYQGEMNQAFDTLKEVSESISPEESPFTRVMWFKFLSSLELCRGHMKQAEAILMDGLRYLEHIGLSDTPLRYLLDMQWATIFYYRSDLVRAEKLAGESMAYAEAVGHRDVVLEGCGLMFQINLATGNTEGASGYLQKMRQLVPPDSVWTPYANALWVILAVRTGDEDTIRQWAIQRQISLDEPLTIFFILECFIHAFFLVISGRGQEALTLLEKVKMRSVQQGLEQSAFAANIHIAATHAVIGELEEAKAILEQALVFAAKEGYVRIFVEFAPFLTPVLNELAKEPPEEISPSFFSTVLEACGITRKAATDSGNGYHKLTRRETEILTLVAQGYKNEQIAEKTFVSLDTVKSHVKHIFEKLGAETRVQAIRRAEELKIYQSK